MSQPILILIPVIPVILILIPVIRMVLTLTININSEDNIEVVLLYCN